MAMLEVRDLEAGYGEVKILWGVNLSLQEGQLTALVGSNGAGKTTVLRSVMNQVRPWGGSIYFLGREVNRISAHEKAAMGLILVPEARQLFTDMTVVENLEMGASSSRALKHYKQNLERVYTLFPRLKERYHQKAGTLSGGEQQMLAIARGLMADPIVLMIDELSLGLAPLLTIQLFSTLKQLRAEGLTILLVEQNVQTALSISDYGYVLSEGRTHLEGPARKLLNDPQVRTAYLGV